MTEVHMAHHVDKRRLGFVAAIQRKLARHVAQDGLPR